MSENSTTADGERGEGCSLAELRVFIRRLYIPDPTASLRVEEEKKCLELAGFLGEVHRLIAGRGGRARALTVVDAAAGKGYLGVAIASLAGPRCGRLVRVRFIEREPSRLDAIRSACDAGGIDPALTDFIQADASDERAWQEAPDLAVALHACGEATDQVIRQATRRRARHILVAPCCVASWLPAARRAEDLALATGLPRHAEVRRRFVEACVLGERVLELEAAGWETVTVPFVAASVTPYNVLLRARRAGEPRRMHQAESALARFRNPGAGRGPASISSAY